MSRCGALSLSGTEFIMTNKNNTNHEAAMTQPHPPFIPADEVASGNYPAFGYLWHLGAAHVLDLDAKDAGDYEVKNAVWFDDRLRRQPARIALIDTGLADHRNLENAVLPELFIDLGTHEGGAAYLRRNETWDDFLHRYGAPADMPRHGPEEPRGKLPGLADKDAVNALVDTLDLSPEEKDAFVAKMAARVEKGVVLRDVTAQDQRYPTHGTASAGLLVGSPIFEDGKAEYAAGTLPYFGVDPWSNVFSVATSFEPEPMQLALAVLYAYANGADVICMPRGSDNPDKTPRPDPRKDPTSTRYDEDKAGWALLDAVLIAVSKRVPIVCAAGNSGDDRLRYPALLASKDDNGIIAVGAVTALANRSGYSNYGEGLTLVAPSNDSRVYNRHQQRLDWRDRAARSHNWLIHRGLDGGIVEFSHWAPVSLDIPGARGYKGGLASRRQDASRSDFTLFGGTSAASTIVAGVVALMCRAMPAPSDMEDKAHTKGALVKDALVTSAAKTLNSKNLTADVSNASDLPSGGHYEFSRMFGAGVVNAKAAIHEICRRL